jgi:hypothetical protein
MIVPVKYIILTVGIMAALYSIKSANLAAGFTAAGAMIAYAIIEKQDLKILNEPEEEKE